MMSVLELGQCRTVSKASEAMVFRLKPARFDLRRLLTPVGETPKECVNSPFGQYHFLVSVNKSGQPS